MSLSFMFFLSTRLPQSLPFFFFNDTATTEIYTLSLHDALPISCNLRGGSDGSGRPAAPNRCAWSPAPERSQSGLVTHFNADRKSTRLNSSHGYISYAVFCLKKKKKINNNINNIVIVNVPV